MVHLHSRQGHCGLLVAALLLSSLSNAFLIPSHHREKISTTASCAYGGSIPPSSLGGEIVDGDLVRTAADQRWETIHGNYILRPQTTSPKAVVHFLGGAFVGAAPHVAYRYMLERLADEHGYLVVATPYQMSFNHLEMCESVASRFDKVLPVLQDELGGDVIPTIGVGHSCGSLLHLLMSSRGVSTIKQERIANVLMSFNNKPASESIPYFHELVTPLSKQFVNQMQYYSDNPNYLNFVRLSHEARAASDVGFLLNEMEKAEAMAGRDVDFLWHELRRARELMRPPTLEQPFLPPFVAPQSLPPSRFSDAARFGVSALLRPAKRTLQTITLINQVIDAFSQVPLLLEQINDGAMDFFPAPGSIQEFARKSYQTPKTLILQYQDDGLDESEALQDLLSQHHPQKQVSRRILSGGHSAPLIAPPLHVAQSAERTLGPTQARERLKYQHADATVREVASWLAGLQQLGGTAT